jgi:hypothetical protein
MHTNILHTAAISIAVYLLSSQDGCGVFESVECSHSASAVEFHLYSCAARDFDHIAPDTVLLCENASVPFLRLPTSLATIDNSPILLDLFQLQQEQERQACEQEAKQSNSIEV